MRWRELECSVAKMTQVGKVVPFYPTQTSAVIKTICSDTCYWKKLQETTAMAVVMWRSNEAEQNQLLGTSFIPAGIAHSQCFRIWLSWKRFWIKRASHVLVAWLQTRFRLAYCKYLGVIAQSDHTRSESHHGSEMIRDLVRDGNRLAQIHGRFLCRHCPEETVF